MDCHNNEEKKKKQTNQFGWYRFGWFPFLRAFLLAGVASQQVAPLCSWCDFFNHFFLNAVIERLGKPEWFIHWTLEAVVTCSTNKKAGLPIGGEAAVDNLWERATRPKIPVPHHLQN